MSVLRLVISSLLHHWRTHFAVALGVAAATAVLTGALVVGDSVRGSLRGLVLDRLQGVDEALVLPRFFRAQLAEELRAQPEFRKLGDTAVPAIVLEGTVDDPKTRRRAAHVSVLGIDDQFMAFAGGDEAPMPAPPAGQLYLNEALAKELGAAKGSECIVRLPIAREVPADSALGRKTETTQSVRMKVTQIVGNGSLGEFSLRPNQAAPLNLYLNLPDVQSALNQPGKVNAVFVGGETRGVASLSALAQRHELLAPLLRPKFADFGLNVQKMPAGYFLLESDRMLLEPAVAEAAERAFAPVSGQPVFTYLANTLADGERQIPYATITAIDFGDTPPMPAFMKSDGEPAATLKPDEIALNAWAAEDLAAKVGDTLRVTYFEPESTHGNVRERTVELRLAAVIAMEGPAIDSHLTPTLPGVTDQLSIADWNPPFPFDSARIRPKDEAYWDQNKATPKAYVSLATGRKLWGSRFGDTTSMRIPNNGTTTEEVTADLVLDPVALGFEFQPVKLLALWASRGTTPFEFLFLGFSFFIIAAALALVAVLFRLGIDGRARQVGLLVALGWSLRKIRRLLLAEGAIVATIGSSSGVLIGVGYAWLMLAGLRTWWLAAITTPFLTLHYSATTLTVGGLVGIITSLGVIYRSVARLRHTTVRTLLAGAADEPIVWVRRASPWARWTSRGALLLAVVVGLSVTRLSGEAQAGAFFGSGALVLIALLALVSQRLRSAGIGSLVHVGSGAIARLALRNAARNPGRSTLTIGLIAAASFLIIAISAFRLDPAEEGGGLPSGTGGFALVAESRQPIYQDLNSEDGQFDLGFSTTDQRALANAHVYSLRLAEGEDASCLNLYQATQPRVLGVPPALVEHGGFEWAATAAETPEEKANPWLLLSKTLPADAAGHVPIPMVLDAATAMYALHLGGVGAAYEMDDGHGGRLHFQVVGLLKNSILQGSLVIGEAVFLTNFPDTSGYRVFLIDAPRADAQAVSQSLEGALGEFGFDAQPTAERLAGYFAVQNTYLSTFQSLGALGLLLGTFGLAAVQLRNVAERRAELALLRATGFRRALVARMVLWENAVLLAGGLAIGSAAALVAVLPHLASGAASLPWASLAGTLSLVLGVGLVAGMAAVAAAVRAPILAVLRGE